MAAKRTGGPAFPLNAANMNLHGAKGMTLRQYYIAHAPAEPQPWFEPEMRTKPNPNVPEPEGGLSDEERKEVQFWRDEGPIWMKWSTRAPASM